MYVGEGAAIGTAAGGIYSQPQGRLRPLIIVSLQRRASPLPRPTYISQLEVRTLGVPITYSLPLPGPEKQS